MIDLSFGNFLTTLTTLPVEEGKIDFQKPTARVWYQRSNSNTLLLNNGQPSLYDDTFTVEVMSTDNAQVQQEASNIRTALHGYRGLMFPDKVLGVFVSDAQDDYTPKNMGIDDGFFVAAFQVQILS